MKISDNMWNDVQFLAQTWPIFSELPTSLSHTISISVGELFVVSIVRAHFSLKRVVPSLTMKIEP